MKGDTTVLVGLVVAVTVIERRARRRRREQQLLDAQLWAAYAAGWFEGRAFTREAPRGT